MRRIVIIKDRDSYLLYGDTEDDDDRFTIHDGQGHVHGTALPVLISEGWKIKSITPMGNAAVVLLQTPEEDTDEGQEGGD